MSDGSWRNEWTSVKHRETNRETMYIMLNLNCCLEDFRLDCHQQVSTQKLPLQPGFPSSRLCRRINVSPSLENLIKKTCQGNGKKGNGSRTCVDNIRICNCKNVIIIWSTNLKYTCIMYNIYIYACQICSFTESLHTTHILNFSMLQNPNWNQFDPFVRGLNRDWNIKKTCLLKQKKDTVNRIFWASGYV